MLLSVLFLFMNPLFFPTAMTGLFLMFLLQKSFQKVFPSFSSKKALIGACFIAVLLLFASFGGHSLVSWVRSFSTSFSIPSLLILALLIIEEGWGTELFSSADWKAVSLFGASASLILYPAALGLGPIDPYTWGWNSSLFFLSIALITALLLLKKNHFGILLLAALAAFEVGLQESTNLWDYLIDPVYGLIAISYTLKAAWEWQKKNR